MVHGKMEILLTQVSTCLYNPDVPSNGVNRNGWVNRNKTQKSFSDLNFPILWTIGLMNNFVFQGDRGCQQCADCRRHIFQIESENGGVWGASLTYFVPKIFGKKVVVRTLPPTWQPHKEMLQPCLGWSLSYPMCMVGLKI